MKNNQIFIRFGTKIKLLTLFLGCNLALFILFSIFPDLAISLYLKGIFQVFRLTHDYTFGLLPIGSIYLLLISLIIAVFLFVFKCTRHPGFLNKVSIIFQYIFGTLLAFAGFFYTLWGFNYFIPNDNVAYSVEPISFTKDYLFEETQWAQEQVTKLRNELSTDTAALGRDFYTDLIESEIRIAQESVLADWDWPVYGKVRVRVLKPSGALLRLSTAGIYIPHALEGHIDGGMFHLQYPFTMAHEMAHGYGFTDEGFCNFVGFVSCLATDNNYIKYSAWLSYWRYLMNDLRKADRACYDELRLQLAIPVRRDLNEIYTFQDRYPDLIPVARDVIYDAYLKSHGVKTGLVSYGEMTKMVYLWKSQNPNNDIVTSSFYKLSK